nr:hypothetical protein GCM10017745_52560 [Saccharothrix mutabilis subsp. capreolus]
MARVAGGVLDAAGDVGEERVADVQDHQADGAGCARAQLAGGVVADEPEFVDRAQDAFRVAGATRSGRLSTLDTVPTDTRARVATSRMLTGAPTAHPSSRSGKARSVPTGSAPTCAFAG